MQRTFNRGNYYFKDSTLYYGDNIAQTLDSIQLHYTDFKPSAEVVYTPTTVVTNYLPWLIGLLLAIVGSTIYYVLKYFVVIKFTKKWGTTPVKPVTEKIKEPSNVNNDVAVTTPYFDERELQVLQLLYDNSIIGATTTIDALNNVLGVTKKATDIQKKQRSDVISSINKKFVFISNNEQPIMDKTRTEFDKRSFVYFIATDRLAEIEIVIT